jgi:hypothetical protein
MSLSLCRVNFRYNENTASRAYVSSPGHTPLHFYLFLYSCQFKTINHYVVYPQIPYFPSRRTSALVILINHYMDLSSENGRVDMIFQVTFYL